MSGYWLDKAAIKDAITRGAHEALDEIGDEIAVDARRRAPIRKVFKEKQGHRRKFRAPSEGERSQAIARAGRYYSTIQPDEFKRRRAVAHLQHYAKVQLPRKGSANSVSRSSALRHLGHEEAGTFTSSSGASQRRGGGYEPGPKLNPLLTTRGRYEVRTGRAIHLAPTGQGSRQNVQVGGALKASIGSEGVIQTSTGQSVTVSAAIGYAKYVEFPTVRTAAQPFLLPALHAKRGDLAHRVAVKIKEQLGG